MIVYQTNKKTGITYAYENQAYWDKEKQQSRSKRKLIGKVDKETGEIIPTRSYNKQKPESNSKIAKRGPVPITAYKRSFFGATYLFDQIGKLTSVEADLKACFPADYKKILSVAYYLITSENNPLSRFSHWHKLHIHLYGEDIASQRSSELFQSIDEGGRMRFFEKQGKRRIEKEYWAFDTTSISSYSETLCQVKKGRNKEYDRLPQINLALLFGETSGLPFYYRKLPGNITDVKTVKQLMREFDIMGYKKVKIVMDRGFYSKANIDAQAGVYGVRQTIEWNYEQKRPYKGDTIKEKRRAYLLLYYSPDKAAKDQAHMNDYLTSLYNDLKDNAKKEYRMQDYDKYFTVTETLKRGKKIEPNEKAMLEASKNYGYFALLTNEVMSASEGLSLYRSKDIVEKGFGNLKERLNFRRMHVSSELSLNGKLFVEFIALIYLSYIKKIMQDAKLFENYTIQGLIDELDVIELFEAPDKGRILGEITEKQKGIYESLGIQIPSL